MSPRAERTVGWSLVGLQAVLLVALVVLPWRVSFGDVLASGAWLWIGLVLIVSGLIIAVTAMVTLGSALTATPVPHAHAALCTAGIYGHIRHPIYTGLLIAAAGFTVSVGTWWQLGVCIVLVVFFVAKSRWEDRMLARRHPGEWQAYALRTGAIIPRRG